MRKNNILKILYFKKGLEFLMIKILKSLNYSYITIKRAKAIPKKTEKDIEFAHTDFDSFFTSNVDDLFLYNSLKKFTDLILLIIKMIMYFCNAQWFHLDPL